MAERKRSSPKASKSRGAVSKRPKAASGRSSRSEKARANFGSELVSRARKVQAIEPKPASAGAPVSAARSRPEYMKLGELLVRGGVLSEAQRDEIVEAQRNSGRPFGDLAERMFGVSPRAIERAWGQQLVSLLSRIDLDRESIDSAAISAISRRQAWQFEVFPLRFAGGGLVVCTTEENLIRAMKFAGWRLGGECQFVLADRRQLGAMLERHFPIDGMSLGSVAMVA